MGSDTPAAPSATDPSVAAAAAADPKPVDTGRADPSPGAPEGAPAAATSKDAKSDADSSAADQGAKQPRSLLDVVKSAVEPEKAAGESPDPKKASQEQPTAAAVEPDAAKKDGEDEQPPFHEHPAWQKKLKTIREQGDEIAKLKPAAESFGKVVGFMEANGLVPDEVSTGFEVMALIKHNPAKAREVLQGYIDRIDEAIGNKLPADLTEKVQTGAMDEASALELSRSRAAAKAAETRATATEHAGELQRREAAAQQTRDACSRAVTAWENERKAADPDWKVKEPLLMDRISAIITADPSKRPATPEAAVALARDALKDVETRLAPMRPARVEPKRPTPSSQTAGAPQEKPKSLADAVRLGLRMTAA